MNGEWCEKTMWDFGFFVVCSRWEFLLVMFLCGRVRILLVVLGLCVVVVTPLSFGDEALSNFDLRERNMGPSWWCWWSSLSEKTVRGGVLVSWGTREGVWFVVVWRVMRSDSDIIDSLEYKKGSSEICLILWWRGRCLQVV